MSVQVLFRVVCQTQKSQMVYIVGNNSTLGNWNPQNGFKLITNSEQYPLWMNEEPLDVEPNLILEFKIVIYDGMNFQWEMGANRLIQILSQQVIVILIFNSPSIIIHNIKRLFSNTNLANITEFNARRVSIHQVEKLFDSDEDSVIQIILVKIKRQKVKRIYNFMMKKILQFLMNNTRVVQKSNQTIKIVVNLQFRCFDIQYSLYINIFSNLIKNPINIYFRNFQECRYRKFQIKLKISNLSYL